MRRFHDLKNVRDRALDELCEEASQVRDLHWGSRLTFSPKVFLPLTNLCRNRCSYCTFRKSPADPGAHTMTHQELARELDAAASSNCTEALFCLGDTPEKAFSAYRATLAERGHDSTVDFLVEGAEMALARDVFPHTNAGILTRDEMVKLRRVNVSLGLMLESVSERLCERGGPHFRAPDKRPAVRLQMTREAGELRIPFTSGILIGIGETAEERVDTLLAIRELHLEYGHIQEVIVQNFRAKNDTEMRGCQEPDVTDMRRTVALARLIMPPEVSVQAPPNLNARELRELIGAGINDFGGVSPLTPDFINPRHPWPQLRELEQICSGEGFALGPRLPIYPDFINKRFLDPSLLNIVREREERLRAMTARSFASQQGTSTEQQPEGAFARA